MKTNQTTPTRKTTCTVCGAEIPQETGFTYWAYSHRLGGGRGYPVCNHCDSPEHRDATFAAVVVAAEKY